MLETLAELLLLLVLVACLIIVIAIIIVLLESIREWRIKQDVRMQEFKDKLKGDE